MSKDFRCKNCGHLLGKGHIELGYVEILCTHKGRNTQNKKCNNLNRFP